MAEKATGGQLAPKVTLDAILLDVSENSILLFRGELFEVLAVATARLGSDRVQTLAPCVLQRWHVCVPKSRAAIVMQHVVNPRDDRHRLFAIWLRNEPIDDRFEQ